MSNQSLRDIVQGTNRAPDIRQNIPFNPTPAVDDRAADDDPDSPYPKRLWTGGPGTPQKKVFYQGTKRSIKPTNYYYTVRDAAQEAAVIHALQGRVWEEDIDPFAEPVACRDCTFRSRSRDAMLFHMNHCHPVGKSYMGNVPLHRPD